jgi:hypothetical protein
VVIGVLLEVELSTAATIVQGRHIIGLHVPVNQHQLWPLPMRVS